MKKILISTLLSSLLLTVTGCMGDQGLATTEENLNPTPTNANSATAPAQTDTTAPTQNTHNVLPVATNVQQDNFIEQNTNSNANFTIPQNIPPAPIFPKSGPTSSIPKPPAIPMPAKKVSNSSSSSLNDELSKKLAKNTLKQDPQIREIAMDNTKLEVRISNNQLSFINPEKVNDATVSALLKANDVIDNVTQIDLSNTKITHTALINILEVINSEDGIEEEHMPLSNLRIILIVNTPIDEFSKLKMLERRAVEDAIPFVIKHSVPELNNSNFEYISKENYNHNYKASENPDEIIKIIDLNKQDTTKNTSISENSNANQSSNITGDTKVSTDNILPPSSNRNALLEAIRSGNNQLKPVSRNTNPECKVINQNEPTVVNFEDKFAEAIQQRVKGYQDLNIQVSDAGILDLTKYNQHLTDNHLTDLFKNINHNNDNTKYLKTLNLAKTNVTKNTLNTLYANIDLLPDFTTLNVFDVVNISKEELLDFANKVQIKKPNQPIKIHHSFNELVNYQSLENIEFIYHDENAQQNFENNLNGKEDEEWED